VSYVVDLDTTNEVVALIDELCDSFGEAVGALVCEDFVIRGHFPILRGLPFFFKPYVYKEKGRGLPDLLFFAGCPAVEG